MYGSSSTTRIVARGTDSPAGGEAGGDMTAIPRKQEEIVGG
jgi:hypothetical protein